MKGLRIFFTVLAVSVYLLGGMALFAETFRVHAALPLKCTDITTEAKTNAGINDALLITLPDDMTYVSGIELKFKIPEVIAAWRDTIAYSLYENLSPAPSEATIDYSGTRISVGTFPGKLSHIIYIPLSEDMEIKQSPYHEKLAVIPTAQNKVIFFRMQLAMKGVPEEFENAEFEVTAKPVLFNKGKLRLTISEPNGERKNYEIYIDEKPFSPQKNGDLLTTGEHRLSVTSDDYRNEVRTFRIEQAKTTNLALTLRGIEPTVKVIGPENAQVFFDGAPLTNIKDEFVITTGDHTVRFVIGDYEVVRTLTAINGRTYTVNLAVDAIITDDSENSSENVKDF